MTNTEFEMLNLEHFLTPKRLNRSIVNDSRNAIKWLMVAVWFSSGTITSRLGLGKDRGLG